MASASSATEGVTGFFGGVASLAEHLDKTVLIVLRDGRVLLGALASYDQYGSIVLERARERHVARGSYADVDMGLYLVRGESIALLGEVDEAMEAGAHPLLTKGEWEDVRAAEEGDEALLRAAAAGRAVLAAAARGGGEGGSGAGGGGADAAALARASDAVAAAAGVGRGGGGLRGLAWAWD